MAEERKNSPQPGDSKGKDKRYSEPFMNFELPESKTPAQDPLEEPIEVAEVVEEDLPVAEEEPAAVVELAEDDVVVVDDDIEVVEDAAKTEEEPIDVVEEAIEEVSEVQEGAVEVVKDEAEIDEEALAVLEEIAEEAEPVEAVGVGEEERVRGESGIDVVPEIAPAISKEELVRGESGIDLVSEKAPAVGNEELIRGESGIDLVSEKAPTIGNEELLRGESGIDLVSEKAPAVGEEGLIRGESGIDVVSQAAQDAGIDEPSGIDILSEALDSGLDLAHDKRPMPPEASKKSGSESDIDLEALLGDSSDSSAVDLGRPSQDLSLPATPMPETQLPKAAQHANDQRESQGAQDDSEAVEVVEEDAAAVNADEEIVVAADEHEAANYATVKDAIEAEEGRAGQAAAGKGKKGRERAKELVGAGGGRKRGGFVPFILGGFLATLALGGGAAAAWYFNVLPPSPTAEKKPAIKPVAAIPAPQANVQEGAEASGAQLKAVEDKLAALTAAAAKEADDRKQLEQDYAALKNTLTEANIPQDPDQIKPFMADLVGARKKLAEINDGLAKAGVKDLSAKKITELAAGQAALAKDHDALVKDREAIVQDRDGLAKDRDALNAAIDAALKELKEGQYLGDDPDRVKLLVEGSKNARLARELIAAKAQNAFAATPDQRLSTILVLLGDRGFTDAKELASLKVYLDWILSKDSGASPEARAKALYAEALLERNRGHIPASALALEQLSKEGEAFKSLPALQTAAARTLKELNDPAAYYLPAVERQVAAGQIKAAVDELNAGLTAFPGQPLLLLKRAELAFDAAGRQGKIDAATQKRIREDAEAARKDPALAAESFYVVGRMEERNGDFAKAEENYRAAFKLAGPGEPGDRYRAALARVLQRELTTGAGNEEEMLQPTSAAENESEIGASVAAPAQVTGEGATDPAAKRRLEESIKIAEELIKREIPGPRAKAT